MVYLADANVEEADLPVQFQGNLWTSDALVVLKTIQSISAERQIQLSDAQFRRACCRIVSEEGNGEARSLSGILIGENKVASLSGGERPAETIAFFGQQKYEVVNWESSGGGYQPAILELCASPSVEPVPFAVGVPELERCVGFGFPSSAQFGLPFSGEILASDISKDGSGMTYTAFNSGSLSRIKRSELSGIAGAAVWGSGAVVGLIHSFNPALDLFFLQPAERFLPLLDREAAPLKRE